MYSWLLNKTIKSNKYYILVRDFRGRICAKEKLLSRCLLLCHHCNQSILWNDCWQIILSSSQNDPKMDSKTQKEFSIYRQPICFNSSIWIWWWIILMGTSYKTINFKWWIVEVLITYQNANLETGLPYNCVKLEIDFLLFPLQSFIISGMQTFSKLHKTKSSRWKVCTACTNFFNSNVVLHIVSDCKMEKYQHTKCDDKLFSNNQF